MQQTKLHGYNRDLISRCFVSATLRDNVHNLNRASSAQCRVVVITFESSLPITSLERGSCTQHACMSPTKIGRATFNVVTYSTSGPPPHMVLSLEDRIHIVEITSDCAYYPRGVERKRKKDTVHLCAWWPRFLNDYTPRIRTLIGTWVFQFGDDFAVVVKIEPSTF